MKEAAYFSWENFHELADLDSHISFASQLINKYEWEAEIKKGFEVQLNKIIVKQKDKQLNLSIIGEFTTGKSTFINAIIRDNLLVSSVLQGTTAANTVIEHYPEYVICLQYHDEKKEWNEYANASLLCEGLKDVTTDPQIAQNLYAVRVGLPSESLKKGIRIIDTPGTNTTERWHEDVTKTALRDLSDLSIILVDATRPLPETLCNFIETNLSDTLYQCAFIVTKLDLLPERERNDMLKYIHSKLSILLEQDDLMVLPYVSPEVINTFDKGFVKASDKNLLNMSLESEKAIVKYMARQRMKAQAQKLVALIQNMYDSISTQILSLNKSFNDELALLIKTQQADLSVFISKQKTERLAQYNWLVRDGRTNKVNAFHKSGSQAKSSILKTVNSKDTIDKLKDYVHDSLSDDCYSEALNMIKSGEKAYADPKKWFGITMETFQKEFERHFEDLKILQISFNKVDYSLPSEIKVKTSDLSGAASYIADELSKENWTFGGAIATCTAIGTAILPGIGTGVGFLAGLFAGAAMSPDINEVKGKLKNKLNSPLDSYFNGVIGDVTSTYDFYTNLLSQNIPKEIDRYLDSYEKIVKTKLDKQNKKKAEIETKIGKLQSDLREIKYRQARLNSIATQIEKQ